MNVLSLFDGISCAQVALERAGINVDNYFASEIDKHSIKVTQYNYPNTIQLGDVIKIDVKDLPQIDLLIGGSPCQGFSQLGKGLNFNDPRSKLFFEFVRLLKECKPKYFLLENVKMKKEWRNIISNLLGIEPILINSNLLSAQNRPRLYWTNIGCIEQPKDRQLFIKDIIEPEGDRVYLGDWRTIFRIPFSNGEYFDYIDISKFEFAKQFRSAFNLNSKHPCLICTGNRHFILCDNKRIKYTSEIERERLQTLPDNYTNLICKTARHKVLGNCFTVDVIVHILKSMRKSKAWNQTR